MFLFQLISTAIDTDIGEAVKKSESFDDDQERPRGSKPSSPRDEIKTVDDDKQEQEEEEEKGRLHMQHKRKTCP